MSTDVKAHVRQIVKSEVAIALTFKRMIRTVTGVVIASVVEVLSAEVTARTVGIDGRRVNETLTVDIAPRRTQPSREVTLGVPVVKKTVAGYGTAVGCCSSCSLIPITLTVTGEEQWIRTVFGVITIS